MSYDPSAVPPPKAIVPSGPQQRPATLVICDGTGTLVRFSPAAETTWNSLLLSVWATYRTRCPSGAQRGLAVPHPVFSAEMRTMEDPSRAMRKMLPSKSWAAAGCCQRSEQSVRMTVSLPNDPGMTRVQGGGMVKRKRIRDEPTDRQGSPGETRWDGMERYSIFREALIPAPGDRHRPRCLRSARPGRRTAAARRERHPPDGA